jgi:hypothetical protein
LPEATGTIKLRGPRFQRSAQSVCQASCQVGFTSKNKARLLKYLKKSYEPAENIVGLKSLRDQ